MWNHAFNGRNILRALLRGAHCQGDLHVFQICNHVHALKEGLAQGEIRLAVGREDTEGTLGGRLESCGGQGDEKVRKRDVELQSLEVEPHGGVVTQRTRTNVVADGVGVLEAKQGDK